MCSRSTARSSPDRRVEHRLNYREIYIPFYERTKTMSFAEEFLEDEFVTGTTSSSISKANDLIIPKIRLINGLTKRLSTEELITFKKEKSVPCFELPPDSHPMRRDFLNLCAEALLNVRPHLKKRNQFFHYWLNVSDLIIAHSKIKLYPGTAEAYSYRLIFTKTFEGELNHDNQKLIANYKEEILEAGFMMGRNANTREKAQRKISAKEKNPSSRSELLKLKKGIRDEKYEEALREIERLKKIRKVQIEERDCG